MPSAYACASDEAHGAIMRRNFGLQRTDPEHYDVVLNTQRVDIDECIDELLALVNTDEMLVFVKVASAVQGVRDVFCRSHPGEELRPRCH